MKQTRIKLIRDFFHPVTMSEMKGLAFKDLAELGSAIARAKGLTQDDVDFELVPY